RFPVLSGGDRGEARHGERRPGSLEPFRGALVVLDARGGRELDGRRRREDRRSGVVEADVVASPELERLFSVPGALAHAAPRVTVDLETLRLRDVGPHD